MVSAEVTPTFLNGTPIGSVGVSCHSFRTLAGALSACRRRSAGGPCDELRGGGVQVLGSFPFSPDQQQTAVVFRLVNTRTPVSVNQRESPLSL